MSQIKLQDVAKTYTVGNENIAAVRTVSLVIDKGDFVSIVGHSGSGKTTLLSMIGGITTPSSGSILFHGTDIHSQKAELLAEYRCEKIGFMFQFASLLPMLTVKENLLLPTVFRSAGVSENAEQLEKKASDLLSMVGLAEKINSYPRHLSGGQQRRVAIARAFMNGPELILADEPTGDLDEETEMDMINFFRSMNSAEKTTFIMVTHNTELAKQTQRRLRMHQGLLQEQ